MDLPSAFQQRIRGQLPTEADLLFGALAEPAPVSIRLNPYKPLPQLPELPQILWNQDGRYLPIRPSFTLDPAFHAGMYYAQEASSMSISFVLEQLDLNGTLALDLCAAPGGKSTLLATHLYERGGMVLANEVIKSRAQTLKENVIKWGLPNVAVCNLDPKHFEKSKVSFDLILVDAPCSGEGMFRKDEAARNEWSEEHVGLCAARQKRILSDILPSLKEGGFMIYSTCTWSEAENEANLEWLAQEHGLCSLSIPFPAAWNITKKEKNGSMGYAFYPHKTTGEGFFIALLQKPGEAPEKKQKEIRYPGKPDKSELGFSLLNKPYLFDWYDGKYAVPENIKELAGELFHSFPLIYIGTKVAEQAGRDWKPAAELAFSLLSDPNAFPEIELSRTEALHFLRRDDLKFPEQPMGWLKLNYLGQGLGYVKNLGNRSNSQYPKEWRILMNLPEELPGGWY